MEQRLFNTFGKRVRILREDLGYSQKEVAAELKRRGVKIGRSYLSILEGSDRIPSGPKIAALADILGTTADYLLMLTDDPNPPKEEEDEEPLLLREAQAGYAVDEMASIYAELSGEDRRVLLRIARALRSVEES